MNNSAENTTESRMFLGRIKSDPGRFGCVKDLKSKKNCHVRGTSPTTDETETATIKELYINRFINS